MTDPTSPRTSPDARTARPAKARSSVLYWGLAVLVAFLVGFGWQYLDARASRDRADRLQERLQATEAEVALGSATLEAQRGHFELARVRASRFFTLVQRDVLPTLSSERAERARALLAQRDEVITALSRSEPGAVVTLYELWARYGEIVPDSAAVPDSMP